MEKSLVIEMYKVVGIDLRDGKPFDHLCAVEKKDSVELIYSNLGYQVKSAEFFGEKTVRLNLNELYLNEVGNETCPNSELEHVPDHMFENSAGDMSHVEAPATADSETEEKIKPPPWVHD